uniref:Putative ovule protein n=1 Tax=Solanum chacoense TaxID=4108 RepID=A0A0V0I6D4_SOLCH
MMYIRNSRQSPAQGFGQVAKVEGSSSLASCKLSLIFKWRLQLVLRVGPRPIYRSSRKRPCSII